MDEGEQFVLLAGELAGLAIEVKTNREQANRFPLCSCKLLRSPGWSFFRDWR